MIASLLLTLACATPAPPDPCAVARLPAPGPLAAEIAAAPDMVARAEIRMREAQRTGDDGFLALAAPALACAIQQDPDLARAPRWRIAKARLHVQSHEFRAALDLLDPAGTDLGWEGWTLRCDAAMEIGDLDGAERACQRAMDLRPGPLLYERAAHLRWSWDDMPGALDLLRQATQSPTDPEATAWLLTQRAKLEILDNRTPLEQAEAMIAGALAAVPGYAPALMLRGRLRLHQDRLDEADIDFTAVGATVEARRGRWEIAVLRAARGAGLKAPADPSSGVRSWSYEAVKADKAVQVAAEAVRAVQRQDRRGYAAWLLVQDPPDYAQAAALMEAELQARQDGLTRLLALAAHPGTATPAEIKAALATTREPRAMMLATALLSPHGFVLDRQLSYFFLFSTEVEILKDAQNKYILPLLIRSRYD